VKLGFDKNWSAIRSWFKPAGFALGHSQPSPPVTAGAKAVPIAEQQPDAMQWSKISKVVTGAIGSAARAGQLQRSASLQLDAAGYALDILRTELVAAMQIAKPAPAVSTVVKLHRPLRTNKQQQALAA
jgi:hypothetical protein